MSAPAGYKQLPSGFWVRDDGSGPYFVDVETGEATAIGTSESGGTVTNTLGPLTLNGVILGNGSRDVKRTQGIRTDGVSGLTLGEAGVSVGAVTLENGTSGSVSIQPPTGALGSTVLTAQAISGVIALMSDVAAVAASVSWKAAVRVATTVAGTLASSFENGATIDGVVLATGDRILIKNQADAAENGIYTVNASGAPTRATDADSGSELVAAACLVLNGTVNATPSPTQWVCTTPSPITLGVTALTFVQFSTSSSGGTSPNLGVVADQAAMLALSTAVPGSYCLRDDLDTMATLLAAPYSTLANWLIVEPAAAASVPSWRGVYTTIASLPSSSLVAGDTATLILTGLNPFTVVYTGSAWWSADRVYKRIANRVAGAVSAAEQIAAGWKWQMPTALLTLFGQMRVSKYVQRNGTANNMTSSVTRLGGAGTTADAAITPTVTPMIGGTNISRAPMYEVIFLSNTTTRTIGNELGSVGGTQNSATDPATVTLTGADSLDDQLYICESVLMAAAVETPTVSLAVELIP